eukprot:scaffold1263_cov170-Ochromonas_danica.AAC.14
MGGSPSVTACPSMEGKGLNVVPSTAASVQKDSFDQIFAFLTPIYYTTEPLLDFEKEVVIKTWKEIINARAAEFWRIKKENADIPCKTPVQYFGNQFFIRLLE